jgi:hypothetical protein
MRKKDGIITTTIIATVNSVALKEAETGTDQIQILSLAVIDPIVVEIVLLEEITKIGNKGHLDSLLRCQQDLHLLLMLEIFLLVLWRRIFGNFLLNTAR